MTLMFIEPAKLSVSKTNMRYARKAPDVSDILPTVRKRGIIQTLLVRPAGEDGHYEIVAGARRFHAARIVAEESGEAEPLPCRVLAKGDDAAAIEASMIENLARLDADEVTQWETFTRLVREGSQVDDIATTFGLSDLVTRRVLALGNLLPRIRSLYRDETLDRATVRHLTLASRSQQRAWLALHDDPQAAAPTGHKLKAWLFGGQSIPARHALFDLDGFQGAMVADLFGDDRYFADPDAFWSAQNEAIEARRAAYLADGWGDVVIVPASEHFSVWEHEKAGKRKGGRVYIDVRSSGEVTIHEGYVSRREARRVAAGEAPEGAVKPQRAELTATLQTYIDLHRHAAVRAALTGHPGVALRLMVAHAIAGSALWRVEPEPQASRNEAVSQSVTASRAEALFAERSRAVLDLLGYDAERVGLTRRFSKQEELPGLFLRLLGLSDAAVLDVIAVVMGESLAAGSVAVEAVGAEIGFDMADWWQADDALFGLIRDRELLGHMVAEVAGETVAGANAGEPGKALKRVIADHLAGHDGRPKVERWVPRWMRFPPAAYTERGGVGPVDAHARLIAARDAAPAPDPGAPAIAFAEAA
jgi:ParB family chromosome partitioning protein